MAATNLMYRLEPLRLELTTDMPSALEDKVIEEATAIAEHMQTMQGDARIPGLVTSNGHIARRFLQAVAPFIKVEGPSFCEWGSGVGIVSCLAALRGWTVTGIEIEPRLVSAARDLARSNTLDVTFVEGSYKPDGIYKAPQPQISGFPAAYSELFDFDVIYIYAWPAERDAVTHAVSHFGRSGTVFMRYGGGVTCEAFRVV